MESKGPGPFETRPPSSYVLHYCKATYMKRRKTLDIAMDHLRKHEIRFYRSDEVPAIQFQIRESGGLYLCTLYADEEYNYVSFEVRQGLRIPKEKLAEVAEWTVRANWRLYAGRFDFDITDGDICFRTGFYLGSGRFVESMLPPLIGASCQTYDRYVPSLMAVVFQSATPEEAISQVEQQGQEQEISDEEFGELMNRLVEGIEEDPPSDPPPSEG